MRRKRRKPRVQWLPVLGSDRSLVSGNAPTMGTDVFVSTFGNGSITFDAFPLTFDYSQDPSIEQYNSPQFHRSLHELTTGNAYRLRRIVGKIFMAPARAAAAAYNTSDNVVNVAMGFIVCRTDESGNPTTDFTEVNPLAQDSANDPWIWRRRWFLGTVPDWSTWYDPSATGNGGRNWTQAWPRSTADCNSVADGPHIDQKTARVISGEERLFCVIAARQVGPNVITGNGGAQIDIFGHLDLRILGSVRTTTGNRGNTSR